MTRMLEAEKSMRERELDSKREAKSATQYEKMLPRAFDDYVKQREKEIELLKTVPPRLVPFFKIEVGEYFDRIKQSQSELKNWYSDIYILKLTIHAWMKSINIQIPSLSDNIRIIESFIDNAKEKFRLTDDIYGNIMISVTESVNNAIKHGNNNEASKNVSISLYLNESQISFKVEDEGVGFDFENLPDPTAPENIEKPGGRGIFLMKHLADEVVFSKNGSLVELIFYIE